MMNTTGSDVNPMDALKPQDMAVKAEDIGVRKASLTTEKMFLLAILAGIFIATGAIFATTVTAGSMATTDPSGVKAFATSLPYGVTRLLAGLSFSVGLILVVIGGAELFTGNTLMLMAFASRKISLWQLLHNWGIVYLGNLVGALVSAGIIFMGKQYTYGNGSIGLTILQTGEAKTSLTFFQAIALGILCNILVCMAIWMCYSARTVADKILAIIPPITCFVAAGFEHSVANMYFIPIALLVKRYGDPAFFEQIGKTALDFPNLTWNNFFFVNLLPVSIGNIIGGSLMVGLIYWYIYSHKK